MQGDILAYGGRIVKHTGDGVFAVFDGGEPLQCALAIQKGLQGAEWGDIGEIRIRMGLHAGIAEQRQDDYFGPVINRTARVMGTGWGGQIVVTADAVGFCNLPAGSEVQDLGVHMLKSLDEPLQLYGLVHPDLALQEFPPLHSLSAHPNNLPTQSTNFVGREEEMAEIGALLENPGCRLVTLVGLRGTGKTRMSLQVAAERIEEYPHGVYFVPLASTKSPDLLVSTIANSLRFTFNSQEDPRVQLLNYFKEKSMLLVMDDFEELIEAADFLAELLKAAPKLQMIVTSHERLNLREEWVVEVAGLQFPKAGETDRIEDYAAVQLFVQGAQRVNLRFSLTDADAPHVLRICELTGGIPLGIELASAWARMLSCREIAEEIGTSIDFLAGSVREGSGEMGSLRAVFEHSWNFLLQEEKGVFQRIAVFRGGLQREAAENVAGDSLSHLALLTTLSALVDKSLLRRSPSGRYEMLEVVRQFAEQKLADTPAEWTRIKDLHCDYFAEFLQQLEGPLRGADQQEALSQITEEIDNVRSGWAWAVDQKKSEDIERMLESLYQFYERRSWLQEGVDALGLAVIALGGTADVIMAPGG